MPIIFIHGVNVRDTDQNFKKDVAARTELLQNLILEPLAAQDDRFKQMAIINPYWGKFGVDFKWKLASLPEVSIVEHLGGGDGETPQSDLLLTATAHELAGTRPGSPQLEALGAEEDLLKRAAEKDLTRFMEALLLPLLLSEIRLAEGTATPEMEGVLQALLATAAQEVADDPVVKAEVAAAGSDEEVIELLKQQVQAHFEQLAQRKLADQPAAAPPGDRLESLGPSWLDDLRTEIGELFNRAKDAPGRAVAIPALAYFRDDLHRNFSRFLGDVFVYLKERGDKTKPGDVVSTVLEAIQTAPKHQLNEPLIIITHSMGGNILYDILTHYAPDLKVDVWISVGGQVAQFEEMKLFLASDKGVGSPQKVEGLRPRVGYWLNIYDPADTLSFKAAPVFADVNADLPYLTGASSLKAHSEYFGRASFYKLVRTHIEQALL